MFPAVFQTLKASTEVRAIVDTRIFRHGVAPQDTTRPYVTWFVVVGVPENQLSGTPPVDRMSVQVDAWHQTDAGVVALAQAIRDALEPRAQMTRIALNERESETKLFRIALEFDWFVDR